MGNESSEPHIEMLQPQPQPPMGTSNSDQDKFAKKKLRASQSFDESVLGQDDIMPGNNVAQQSQNYHATSDPEGKEEELDDLEPELEAIYEPPPIAANRPKTPKPQNP